MSLQDAKLILTSNGYKAVKVYAVKPTDGTGDATVTRNTTKTRVNSSGLIESMAANVLAPDYLNGVCPALNVEGQATNKALFSEQLDNAFYTKITLSITPNTHEFLGRGFVADTINYDAGGGILNFTTPVESGKIYVQSQFINVNSTNINSIVLGFSGSIPATLINFNLSTKETSINFGTPVSHGAIDYGNGWFLVFISAQSPNTGSATSRIQSVNMAGKAIITGIQVTEGAEPTSYIPTTTAAVTRSADTVTVPIPAGTTEIIEKYEDGTTNTITNIPASPYTVPTGKRYEYILMR